MAKIIQDLSVELDQSLEEALARLMPNHGPFRVLRKSVDARKKTKPHFVYTLEVADTGESLQVRQIALPKRHTGSDIIKPLIVGSGPAGLFAALRLVERGVPCTLIERGSPAEKRILAINRFWRYGELDANDNVCFGEGGAGLYSDGKLITRIKSPHIPYVLNRLVKFGAPAEIEYLANPHVGSDKIRRLIPRIRQYLIENGCEIHFQTNMRELLVSGNRVHGVITTDGRQFHGSHVILATGHSAEDVIYSLHKQGVAMEAKDFAMGLRIEHPQKAINQIQYRDFAEHPQLSSANYRLAHHDAKTGVGVYSFCMCPGGFVLSSGTEKDRLVCNGMSNYQRNSPFANSAIVVSVHSPKLAEKNIFAGMKLREELESKSYVAVRAAGGTRELPAQMLTDFLDEKESLQLKKGSSPSGAISVRLDQVLPEFIREKLREGLIEFNRSMKGFIHPEAMLYGVESRTSCPIRILRNENFESPSHPGLFPAGEGAGYAGGITSAACDGVRIADQMVPGS